jgi:hypothetical protein
VEVVAATAAVAVGEPAAVVAATAAVAARVVEAVGVAVDPAVDQAREARVHRTAEITTTITA